MAEQKTRSPEAETAPGEAQPQQNDAKHNGDSGTDSLAHELRQAIREAALEVLGPAARQATMSAAKYAVSKGPELVTERVMPAVSKNGGPGGLAEQVASKAGAVLSG